MEETRSEIDEEARCTLGAPNERGSKCGGSMAEGVTGVNSRGRLELPVTEREALARREVGANTSTRSVSGVSPREIRLSLRKNGYPVVSYSCDKLSPNTDSPSASVWFPYSKTKPSSSSESKERSWQSTMVEAQLDERPPRPVEDAREVPTAA